MYSVSILTRLKLLRLTAERPLSVNELTHLLNVSQSGVSQHLARLRVAGLVSAERRGKQVLYSARLDGIARFDRAFFTLLARPLKEVSEMNHEWTRWKALYGEKGSGLPARALTVAIGSEGYGNVPLQADNPMRILFVCTANAARSQMAEAWAKALAPGHVEPASAGLEPAVVHPLAIEVMEEVGIDISHQVSKALRPEDLAHAGLVITLCGAPSGWRPYLPEGVAWRYWPFEDPARATGPKPVRLSKFREVRDGLRLKVESLLQELQQQASRTGEVTR